MLTFYSGKYRCLELFLETEPDMHTFVTLSDGLRVMRKQVRHYNHILFPLEKYTVYALSLGDVIPGLMYLSGCDSLPTAGIRFLQPDGSLQCQAVSPSCSCHFSPCPGPIHIPGGLRFHDGYYHMFYTCAPFPTRPDILYCGHAVSRDMLRFTHLPLFAQLQPEATVSEQITGALLPGGTVMDKTRIRLFFVHSIRKRMHGTLLRELLMYADTKDMFRFSDIKRVPLSLPSYVGPAFRSPAFTIKGAEVFLSAGSTFRGAGAVLLFRQTCDSWTFCGPLLQEKTLPAPDASDFFPIGRTHAAVASFSSGGVHTVCWYTGTFQNCRFRIRHRGILDFGGDFYAPQTFSENGRRILVASVPGPEGCMTLPREIFTRKGCLCMRPAGEVYSLAEAAVYSGKQENVSLPMSATAFLIQLRFSAPTDFHIHIGTNTDGICLRTENNRIILETADSVATSPPLPLTALEIFADGPVLEVFANDGEATGTKRFSGNSNFLSLSFTNADCVESLRISPLKNCATASDESDEEDPDAPTQTFDFIDYV